MKNIKLLALVIIITLGFNQQVNAVDSTQKISDIFEDENIARVIAEQLTLNSDDYVTQTQLDQVQMLDVTNYSVKSIKGIERLNNLFHMNLSYNEISDLTPFSLNDFNNLNYLNLSHNQIVDITPLKRATALTQVFISDNYIDDISPTLDFASYNKPENQTKLYNFFAPDQIVNLKMKKSLSLSKRISKYSEIVGTYIVYNISDSGVFNETTNRVNWSNLALDINQTTFGYTLSSYVSGGQWTYNANVIVEVEPALVNVKYVNEDNVLLVYYFYTYDF